MNTVISESPKTLYVGIAGVQLDSEKINLGEGIILSKTEAHVFSNNFLSFGPKSKSGYYKAPWRVVLGGQDSYLNSQLLIPSNLSTDSIIQLKIVRSVLFLIRIHINPNAQVVAYSPISFTEIDQICDASVSVYPGDFRNKALRVTSKTNLITESNSKWIATHWRTVFDFIQTNGIFDLAVATIDNAQYTQNTGLTMVSISGVEQFVVQEIRPNSFKEIS